MNDIFIWFFSIVFLVNVFCETSSLDDRTTYTQAILDFYKSEKKLSLYGKYGNDSPKLPRSGQLFHLKDQSWCSSFGKINNIGNLKVILIPYGNCSFQTKIEVALTYNATAVIFINNKNDEPFYEDNNEKIVSVIISKENGKKLTEVYYKYEEKIDCNINPGTHYVDKRWKVSKTSVLFVLVSFILLMCISLAWLVFYYVQRFRHIYHSDRKEKQLLTAAKKAISKLKTHPFSAATHEEDDTCAVCLESYKDGETLRELPCIHLFHKSCIDPWLLYHRTCPMCKSNILKSLGVEIPDSMPLSINVEAASGEMNTIQSHVERQNDEREPSVPPQAWSEQESNCYSSSSSLVSDTESDRSTAALVTSVARV